MVSSRASRSRADMGQMSSQTQFPSAETESHGKSKDKTSKPKRSKRKSAGMEESIDQLDEESARTLLQMRKAQIQQSRAPYYQESNVPSAQVIAAEISPTRFSTEPLRKSKGRKANGKRGNKNRAQTDIYELPDSDEPSSGVKQYPELPSTPQGQIDRSSPSPYRPSLPPANALDAVSTDDDEVAAYEKYANESAGVDPSGFPDSDTYDFSQQPPDPFDHDDVGESIHALPQLPINVSGSPKSIEKPKKKKRKRRTDDQGDKEPLVHEQGRYIPHHRPEAIDDFLTLDMSSANLLHEYEGDTMPIDPELHNMSALPTSTDFSNFNGGGMDSSQKDRRDSRMHGSTKPRKRRRLEELQGANTTDLPYMSPYSLQHDQGNIQDQVLPGYEDMQKQASSGDESSFQDNNSEGDSDFPDQEVQVEMSARGAEKRGTKKARPKKERGSVRKGDGVESAVKEKAENGGAFSAAEGLQLDAFRDNHCEANNMTDWQFNELIQTPMRGNAQVKALFNEIHDILSYRPRMSVQKFCRRRFHNFSRGPWSAEDDEALKQTVAVKGKAWKDVGESLGRMPEDCRDRWRNYLVNSEYRNREQWTDSEVVNLCTAILECMHLMKEDRVRARAAGEDVPECGTESEQEVDDMKHINWQSVSDRMGEHGGGRSRLQCSFKWGQLKKKEQKDFLRAIRESGGIEKRKPASAKNPWRTKLASKKVGNMKFGDVHALLQAVADLDVPEEGNIPWKSLGDDQLRAMWTSTEKRVAWTRMKEKVSASGSTDYRTVANHLLSQILLNEDADALRERWEPDVHGDVSAKKTRKKRKSGKQKDGQEKEDFDVTNPFLQQSNAFVYDSDEMDGNAQDHTGLDPFAPQGYDRYDVLPLMDGPMNAGNGVGSISVDDQEDGFHDGGNANGHLPIADGEVSPEFAGRLQTALLNACN